MDHKAILEKANQAVSAGDYETFLSFCTEDTHWTFIGDEVLQGKQAVRAYMASTYLEPPKFKVENLIGEGEFLTAVGTINILEKSGQWIQYHYCDFWQFKGGKLFALKAFVI